MEWLFIVASVVASFVVVIFFIFIGWCLVWKLYLSKFKLVRELFSQQTPEVDNSSKTQKIL
ncbi:small integral membrane protein 13 [Sipha flava]|uniref:Small integral membrane protein 13 n=1 Tax=Sipha flava TaxID=143950 RepID=A0A8B8GGA7_9HEMI|nr:small integral membrane protein 13 [Sipha flava]